MQRFLCCDVIAAVRRRKSQNLSKRQSNSPLGKKILPPPLRTFLLEFVVEFTTSFGLLFRHDSQTDEARAATTSKRHSALSGYTWKDD